MVVNQQKNADYESDNVKDKNNLLSHALWSGGDYSNNLNEIVLTDEELSISSEWKYNGDFSLKFVSTKATHKFVVDTEYFNGGDDLTITFNCLNVVESVVLRLFQFSNGNWSGTSLNIPPSNTMQEPSITITTSENVSKVRFLVEAYGGIGKVIYVDNIQLSKR